MGKGRSVSEERSNHDIVIDVITRNKSKFVVDGNFIVLSNPAYSELSQSMGGKMSAAAIYTFLKKNKKALAKYAEWGVVRKENKENLPIVKRESENTSISKEPTTGARRRSRRSSDARECRKGNAAPPDEGTVSVGLGPSYR